MKSILTKSIAQKNMTSIFDRFAKAFMLNYVNHHCKLFDLSSRYKQQQLYTWSGLSKGKVIGLRSQPCHGSLFYKYKNGHTDNTIGMPVYNVKNIAQAGNVKGVL